MNYESPGPTSRAFVGNSRRYFRQVERHVHSHVHRRRDRRLGHQEIATYLSEPSDAVNVSGQFSRLPGGPNHVASETVNGVSKQLTLAVQNSDYQRM